MTHGEECEALEALWREKQEQWISAYERGLIAPDELFTQAYCEVGIQLCSCDATKLTINIIFDNHHDEEIGCSLHLGIRWHFNRAAAGFRFEAPDGTQITSLPSITGVSESPRLREILVSSPLRILPNDSATISLQGTIHNSILSRSYGVAPILMVGTAR